MLSQVDMMLAALARQKDLTLATSDRDFEALPDVRTENWRKLYGGGALQSHQWVTGQVVRLAQTLRTRTHGASAFF